MTKRQPKKRKEFSQKEIKDFFEEVNNKRNLASEPIPKRDITADWITTSNSSKGNNKLIKVAAWQIGQKS